MSLGPAEILVILVVALLVFGPHRLPEIARQVGGAMRELRKMQDTVRSELRHGLAPRRHGTSSSSVPAIDPTTPRRSTRTIDPTRRRRRAVARRPRRRLDEPGFAGPSDSFI